jgi:hypothetical protein
MDQLIDVGRWIIVAEEEVTRVAGALTAQGGEHTEDNVNHYNLANLGAPSAAKYLKNLAAGLQVVVTNLTRLADHTDLTELAESLKSSSNGTTGEGA